MYQYWRSNRNVILTAVAFFVMSMTVLLFFLTNTAHENDHHELKTNVVDSLSIKSHQEVEEKYREIIDNHEDPLLIVDVEGGVDFASWNFEVMSGYSSEEIKNHQLFTIIHSEDLPAFIADFSKTIASGEPQNLVGPYRLRAAKSGYRVFVASLTPLTKDGKVEALAIVCRDITGEVDEKPTKEPTETKGSEKENKIRDEEEDDSTRLIVDKLAKAEN